jgi:hypothetical protein
MADAVRETRLWGWLKNASPVLAERLHMTRIENRAGAGCADVEACMDGLQAWIELKTEPRPSSPSSRVKPRFEPTQWPWHRRRLMAGGSTYVLLQVGQGAAAARYLVPGPYLPELESPGMTEARLREVSLCYPTDGPVALLRAAMDDVASEVRRPLPRVSPGSGC